MTERETYVAMDITELQAGDRCIMYGEIVEIAGTPYQDANLLPGTIRVPMKRDNHAGVWASPEPVPWLVAVHRD